MEAAPLLSALPVDPPDVQQLPRVKKLSFGQKLWRVIKKIVNYLAFWRSNPFHLTPQEVSRREFDIMHGREVRQIGARPQPVNERQVQPIALEEGMERIDRGLEGSQLAGSRLGLSQLPVKEEKPKFAEPYLNDALTNLIDIAGKSADFIYKEKVESAIHTVQKGAAGAPAILKMIAEQILKLGAVANKHYGHLISEHGLDKVVTKELNLLVNWLLKNDFDRKNSEAYKTLVIKAVTEKLNAETDEINRNYIAPIINWLLHSDHEKTLEQHLNLGELYSSKTATELCNQIFQTLIEKKIELYTQFLNDKLQKDLPGLIHQFMKKDLAEFAAKLEGGKLLEAISNLPWTNMVDTTVRNVYLHTNGFIEGQRRKNDVPALIKRLQARVNADAETYEEVQLQTEAIAQLKVIMVDPAKYAVDEFWRGFIAEKASENRSVAHPLLQDYVRTRNLDAQSAEAYRHKQKKEYYAAKAKQILDLLIPADKATQVDWLARLHIPEEFKAIFWNAIKIAKEIVGADTLNTLNALITPFLAGIKDNAISIAVETMKSFLAPVLERVLEEKLEQYTHPDELNEIMADSVLPDVLIPQLLQTTAKHVLYSNRAVMSAHFYQITTDADRIPPFKRLQQALYEGTRALLPSINFDTLKITEEKFNTIVTPFLTEIEERLVISKTDKPEEYTAHKVEVLVNCYFAQDDQVIPKRPEYGKLVTNLVSEMSTAGNVAKWGVKKFESALSGILVESMHDVRRSPEFLLKLIMEKTALQFTEEKMRANFFGKTTLPSRAKARADYDALKVRQGQLASKNDKTADENAELARIQGTIEAHAITQTERKLDTHLRTLSLIIHNLAMAKIDAVSRQYAADYTFSFLASAGGYLGTWGAGKVVGTPDDVKKLILDLYKKLLGDPLLNLSLARTTLDLVLKRMGQARGTPED